MSNSLESSDRFPWHVRASISFGDGDVCDKPLRASMHSTAQYPSSVTLREGDR
ncbi:MAG: hypothetical protein V7L01_04570 [Nostoc sp.]|uniref:hypothetical protein n=1 Tax=Nostoc sp. TaxID=1180 RepID=UPI002FFC7820